MADQMWLCQVADHMRGLAVYQASLRVFFIDAYGVRELRDRDCALFQVGGPSSPARLVRVGWKTR